MSDCICGHPKASHAERDGPLRCYHDQSWPVFAWCECNQFRECLDWPDSEGFYWCDGDSKRESIVKAAKCERGILIIGYSAEEWRNEFGPARFVKLTEQNPFAKEPA